MAALACYQIVKVNDGIFFYWYTIISKWSQKEEKGFMSGALVPIDF